MAPSSIQQLQDLIEGKQAILFEVFLYCVHGIVPARCLSTFKSHRDYLMNIHI